MGCFTSSPPILKLIMADVPELIKQHNYISPSLPLPLPPFLDPFLSLLCLSTPFLPSSVSSSLPLPLPSHPFLNSYGLTGSKSP